MRPTLPFFFVTLLSIELVAPRCVVAQVQVHADDSAATASLKSAAPEDSIRPFVPPASIAELEARIREVLDSSRTPGAGLAIVRGDSVIYTGGFGLAIVNPKIPATAATLFRIGSTSKAFVAMAALQLQREGKLSLQDPIKRHLPDFQYENAWEATDPVRIVHLLEHTSGFDDNSFKAYANSDPKPLTLTEGLALDPQSRVSRWRPGTRYAYCNTGPAIVALILERIEGKPFEQIVQERLFNPLGMRTATYFFPDTTRVPMATLYEGDGETPYPFWHVFTRPAGSINASALDMARYVRFLLARGTVNGATLLAREDIERMERSETWSGSRAGLSVGYGLHLFKVADTTGFVWTGHDGGVRGGLSDMSYLPEAGIGYAVQINDGNSETLRQIRHLVRGFLTRHLTPPRAPPIATVPVSVAAQFSGWYRPVAPRAQHVYFIERIVGLARVSFTRDSMIVRRGLSSPVAFLSVDSVRFRKAGESTATIAFVHDAANGRPVGMDTFGSNLPGSSMAQVATPLALLEQGGVIAWLLAVLLGLLFGLLSPVRAIINWLQRTRPQLPPARPLWRTAFAASVFAVFPIPALLVFGGGIPELGTLSLTSVTIFLSGIAFAVTAVLGLVLMRKGRVAETRRQWASLQVARVIMLLHLVAALYGVYWGFIGWRMWA